jgi:hypothetical protein
MLKDDRLEEQNNLLSKEFQMQEDDTVSIINLLIHTFLQLLFFIYNAYLYLVGRANIYGRMVSKGKTHFI